MIFIIVDRVETFQTPTEAENEKILELLINLFWRNEDGPGAKVKLLVSASTTCHLMERLLKDEEVITIPKMPRPSGPSDKIMSTTLL